VRPPPPLMPRRTPEPILMKHSTPAPRGGQTFSLRRCSVHLLASKVRNPFLSKPVHSHRGDFPSGDREGCCASPSLSVTAPGGPTTGIDTDSDPDAEGKRNARKSQALPGGERTRESSRRASLRPLDRFAQSRQRSDTTSDNPVCARHHRRLSSLLRPWRRPAAPREIAFQSPVRQNRRACAGGRCSKGLE